VSGVRPGTSGPAPGTAAFQPAAGTEEPRRFRPSLRYELIGCGLHGHELLGTDADHLRPQDRLFAWEDGGGVRWYRCLRCDAWLPLARPSEPQVEYPPERSEVRLPLRGRPLRDRYVLRLIAIDRALHVLVLSALAVAIFAFATHRSLLHHDYARVLAALQGAFGGPVARSGWVADVNRLFKLSTAELYGAGIVVAAYVVLLAFEMVGLWFARRWAEYLTFVETGVLVPFEIYELTKTVSYLKVITLVLNLAVVLYLLVAHRLFGIRGGAAATAAIQERDTGWAPLERSTPPSLLEPGAEVVGAPPGRAG
jgi:uncharacterized membrane protein (DUF2068 family)